MEPNDLVIMVIGLLFALNAVPGDHKVYRQRMRLNFGMKGRINVDDLISREAVIEAIKISDGGCSNPSERIGIIFARVEARRAIQSIPSIPAVPLEPLCKLLAEMYHCPSSGRPSSGRACHPNCTDEMLETICGLACDDYSDEERWKAFLINWMKNDEG